MALNGGIIASIEFFFGRETTGRKKNK